MKILSIRIKNLASLEGVTEINFSQEPLLSAGIFAITGPTGAGKSTILDALCLALYAKTPRYKQAENSIEIEDVQGSMISQGDVRGILRDGTADGFAEVEFVGVDQQQYRATWSVRRARNKADGNLQQYEVTLKNIILNTEFPGKKYEVLHEIERLVGLNFEQFTRSVLLAQGDFTAFLKAGKDEKSSLLEKLTGTQVYSGISKRIYERHREEMQQLKELELQRQGIPTLTNEELELLATQKVHLHTTIQTQEKRIGELDKEINWHEQRKTLQANLTSAQSNHKHANTAKEEALPRVQQLQQVERVQAVRSPVENLHAIRQQLTQKETLYKQQQEALTGLNKQQETVTLALQQAETILHENIQKQEDAQPLLNQAKTLDVQLAEKEKQVGIAKEEVRHEKDKQQRHAQAIATKQEEFNRVEKEITRLSQWKIDNTQRQPIAEHESLIISKLQNAAASLESVQTISTHIELIADNTKQKKQDKESLNKQYAEIEINVNKARQEYEDNLTALAAIPSHTIEQHKLLADKNVQELTEARACWQLLYTALQDQHALMTKLETHQQNLEQLQKQLPYLETKIEKVRIQKDTSLSMLEKARRAATASVEQLRTQLAPGEPCPVCGSKEHPFAIEHPQLDHVLAELEVASKQQEEEHLKLVKEHSGLKQTCVQLDAAIATQQKELTSKQHHIQTQEANFAAFTIYAICSELPEEARMQWLLTQLQQQKEKQQQLQEQLHAFKKQQQLGETQRNEKDKLEKLFTEIANSLKDTERVLQSLQEQAEQRANELQKVNIDLEAIQKEIAGYFAAEQWFQKWKADPKRFVQVIHQFATEWKTNLQTLDTYSQSQAALSATLIGMQEQVNQLAENVKQKEQFLNELNNQYNDCKKYRMQLFAGSPVATVEEMYKKEVATARQIHEQRRAENDKLRETLTKTITENEQLNKDIQSLQQQAMQLNKNIQQWLSTYNQQQSIALTESELTQLLSFTPEWRETERAALRELDDILTRAQSILKERETALKQHEHLRLSEKAAEELQLLLSDAKAALLAYNRQHNEIDFRQREDAANKQKIGSLQQTIYTQAKQVENWAKLNEVIGSADGKKFRQIAQEYTLDVLLNYANIHLEMLSKRYILQRIPNTLGLQVIDQDMGDEVRTVYSLSGGESFLVSLALALGLASLSSNRMQVESLFIDEGFGSLDPNTLNVAMDALERLHHQGRKVGVISHVQEMTERISVQIRVNKQQSGRSKVEIHQ